jgi:hypothetical protein
MPSSVRRYLQAFGPSTILASASLLAALKLRSTVQAPMTAPIVETLAWLPLAGLALASALAAIATFRLWRREAERGPACPHCGGFQGMVRPGRYGRSDYRTCFDCGRHAPADC